MTAPGQEPDEVMTAKPGGDEQAPPRSTSAQESPAGTPEMDDIGDNHMPADMRETEREKGAMARGADHEGADDEGAD